MRSLRPLATALLACAAGLSATVPAAPALAQEPACAPGTAPAAALYAPKRLAAGRAESVYLTDEGDGVSDTRSVDLPTRRIEVRSADPARPFREVFAAGPEEEWFITATPGDGTARVVVTFREHEYGRDACIRTLQADVQVVTGVRPYIARRVYAGDLEVKLRGTGDCASMRPGSLTFRLRGGGIDKRFVLSDACGEWDQSTYRRAGLGVSTIDDDEEAYPSMTVDARDLRANRRRTYVLTVTQGGRRLRTVRFAVRWSYYRTEYIDEAEDDFVNYCINENRPIYKRNGRLYCVSPSVAYQSIRLLKR